MGMNRTGVETAHLYEFIKAALENPSENVPFSGLHCYDGHVHTTDLMDREAEVTDLVESIADVLDALSEDGIEVPMIIAGGSPSFPCSRRKPGYLFVARHRVFVGQQLQRKLS